MPQDANDPDAHADAQVRQMTMAEQIQLLHGNYPNKMNPRSWRPPSGTAAIALS